MSDHDITILRAEAVEIRSLRHRVLRQGLPIEAAAFDNDDDAETIHAAAFTRDGTAVGCATIMRSTFDKRPAWRLRGMAVDPDYRRRRLGVRLLELCEQHAIAAGPPFFWCNARTPAVPFYRSAGWIRQGSEFDIPTAGPHYVMTKNLQNK